MCYVLYIDKNMRLNGVNNMNKNFLTIYEVADILGLHHKTVRGFIASDKLKAMKLGKQWRIMREDLDHFMGKDSSMNEIECATPPQIDFSNDEIQYTNHQEIQRPGKSRVSISAVVDIQAVNKMKFERISNTLLAVMNSKDEKMDHVTMHIKYDDTSKVCKVFLWGNIVFINEMLSIITIIDKEDSDEF